MGIEPPAVETLVIIATKRRPGLGGVSSLLLAIFHGSLQSDPRR